MAEVSGELTALPGPHGPLGAAAGGGEPVRQGDRQPRADHSGGLERASEHVRRERTAPEGRVGAGTPVRRETERREAPPRSARGHRRGVRDVSASDTSSS